MASKKAKEALSFRRQGKTFKEVGLKLGVGPQRARALCQQAERDELAPPPPVDSIDCLQLSTRTRNAIAADGVSSVVHLGKVELSSLRKIPNLGQKGIDEILASLPQSVAAKQAAAERENYVSKSVAGLVFDDKAIKSLAVNIVMRGYKHTTPGDCCPCCGYDGHWGGDFVSAIRSVEEMILKAVKFPP